MAGPLIDGQYAIPKQTTTTTKKKVAAPTPKKTVWTFMGATYYSLAAYNGAVARYQQLKAKSAAEYRRRAAARAAQQRLVQQAELRRQQLLAYRRRTAQAQQGLARQRSAARTGVEQEAELRRAQDRREQVARAEARSREARRLMEQAAAERRRLMARRGSRPSQHQEQTDRMIRAAERRYAGAREHLLASERGRSFASLQAAWDAKHAPIRVNQGAGRVRRGGESIATTRDVERGDAIRAARESGDYTELLERMARDTEATDGRHVDKELFERVNVEVIQLLQETDREYQAAGARIYAAFEAENWAEMQRLVESSDWRELEARWIRLFGEGRQSGLAMKWAEMQDAIANTHNRWLERQGVPRAQVQRLVQKKVAGQQRPTLVPTYADMTDLYAGSGDWEGVISKAEFDRLLDDLQNGLPAEREYALQKLMELGLDAYERRDGDVWDQHQRDAAERERERAGGLSYLGGAAVRQQWTEMARRNVELFLTGQTTEGLAGGLQGLMRTPGLGQALGVYSGIIGGVTTAARSAIGAVTGGGSLALPDIQFDALFGSGNDFYSIKNAAGEDIGGLLPWLPWNVDTSQAAKDRFATDVRNLFAITNDTSKSVEQRMVAINAFGREWAQGNTTILAEQLLDPLTFVGAGRFLTAGRLANAQAGGIRQLLRAPRASFNDFLRYSIPERWSGISARELRNMAEYLRLARRSGRDFADVAALGPDELAALARETMVVSADEAATAGGAWQRQFESNPVLAQQLFSAVADEADDLAKMAGIQRVSPTGLARDLRYARQAADRAEVEARNLAARQARLVAERRGVRALDVVRRERTRAGQAPAVALRQSPLTTPVLKARRTRLTNDLDRLISERISVARDAKQAADLLDSARDGSFRQLHHDRLKAAVARLRELDAEDSVDPVTGQAVPVKGSVSAARQRIRDFDDAVQQHTNQRPTDSPPGFLNVTMPRVNEDAQYIQSQILHARAQLQAAATGGRDKYWIRRLQQLGEAKDYLEVERRIIKGANHTAKQAVRRYASQLERAISLNRVAARAVTRASGREALIRDIRRRVYGAATTDSYSFASASEVQEFDAVRSALLTQAALPPSVYQEITAFRQQFGDVDLLELAYALSVSDDLLGDLRVTFHQFRDVIRDTLSAERGVAVGSSDVDAFLRAYGKDRLAQAGRITLKRYRELDDVVAEAIREARGWAAKGQIQVGRARKGTPSAFVRHDSRLAEIYAKSATLLKEGVPVNAYDEARTVFGDINLRHNRGVGLRRKAQVLSRASGRSVDEHFDELRDEARLVEVQRNLERMAYRMPSLTEEEIVSAFELRMIDEDLAPFQKRPLTEYQRDLLSGAYGDLTAGADFADDTAAMRILGEGASEHPPFGNRGEMHDWMVEHGHFSPRSAEAIRAGDRVYSVDAERDFWQAGFGYTPEWTDPDWLRDRLRDKRLHDEGYQQVGVFNNDFERIMATQHLTGERLRDEMVFGGEGIQRARSWEELRSWAIERYGDLVYDGKNLIEMSWLMNLDEYDAWLKRADVDGDTMRGFGIDFDPRQVRPEQLAKFKEAVGVATRRSFDRAQKAGELDGDWLPQEQVRFTMDVVDHLMADPRWRSMFQKRPPGARLLDNVGAFWRAAMTWTISFPLMNLLDTVGLKRGILAATYNGFRPLSLVSDAARKAIPHADVLGDRTATWLIKGRNGFVSALDPEFNAGHRAREFARGLTELPVRVSKRGEDILRVDFARAMFDQRYSDLIADGVSADLAQVRALAHARDLVEVAFPSTGSMGPFMHAVNQLIPFFSYNLNLKLFGLKLGIENPWLLTFADRWGDFLEEQNRGIWEMEHPGVPFPENDPNSRRLWFKVGDVVYTVDLGKFSDLTRGLSVVTELGDRTPLELATEFFRVPHPSQAIFLATAFGFNDGKTPWGTQAEWSDVSTWIDLWNWFREGGQGAFDPNDPKSRDAIQMISQTLFFAGFGRISPMKAKVQTFFGFMALDEDKAWEYYDANPDLQQYFRENGTRYRIDRGERATRRGWRATATDAEIAEYDEAMEGYVALRDELDAELDKYYLDPGGAEWKAAKARRRQLLDAYIKSHPILPDVWGFELSPREFAEQMQSDLVDVLVDHYFLMGETAPKRSAYPAGTAGELAFAQASRAWYQMRARWLDAHPQVFDQIYQGRNAIERAWFEHELQWADTMERTSEVKIKQLQLELHLDANPDDEDARALLDTLRAYQEHNYRLLDAESFGNFHELVRNDRGEATDVFSRARGFLQRTVTFRGRSDLRYERATPEERAQIDADQRYADGMEAVWNTIGDDVSRFYDEVRRRGLLDEYFARNPEKEAAYISGNEYRGWMGRWVAALERDDFTAAQQVWDSMPAWVHERYFERHPDSGMRDGQGGGSSTAVQFNGQWFRSAESRDRYRYYVLGDRSIPEPPPGPARTGPTGQGSAYFAAMQAWVELLRANKYEEADAHFRGLPEWMREKYYAKHPDQRARNELDSSALRVGAEYFLAGSDREKLAILQRNPAFAEWVRQHGGDEAYHRGLIMSIYRAIPSSEAWLKRTFRERYPEIFSQEAAGQRRLASVARELAENPEMLPFFERALALQQKLFLEQLKHSKQPPRSWTIERKRRLRKRTKRRAARSSSHWATHFEARRGLRNSAGN